MAELIDLNESESVGQDSIGLDLTAQLAPVSPRPRRLNFEAAASVADGVAMAQQHHRDLSGQWRRWCLSCCSPCALMCLCFWGLLMAMAFSWGIYRLQNDRVAQNHANDGLTSPPPAPTASSNGHGVFDDPVP